MTMMVLLFLAHHAKNAAAAALGTRAWCRCRCSHAKTQIAHNPNAYAILLIHRHDIEDQYFMIDFMPP
jgi:hypothetical protein